MESALFRNILKVLDDGTKFNYSWYEAMHTRVDILLHGEDTEELEQLSIQIYELIYELDRIADRFKADSEISKINRKADNIPVQISDHLFDTLSQCIDAHRKTQGLFDITINTLSHNKESINSIKLFPDLKAVQILVPGIILDINAYVKGYTVDKIKDLILSTSIKNALINLGNSSILGLGHHPFGEGWKIKDLTGSVADVTLHDECLTTSGNMIAGRKHIKHPVSHEFITGKQILSVITPTASLGEVLSTSLLLATGKQRAEIQEQFMVLERCLYYNHD